MKNNHSHPNLHLTSKVDAHSPKNVFGPWEESNIPSNFYSQEIFSLVKNNNTVMCVSQGSTPASPENVLKSD